MIHPLQGLNGFDLGDPDKPWEASERREARRHMHLDEIVDMAMHTETSTLGQEMPDFTLDQLIVKLAMMGETPPSLFHNTSSGYIRLDCSLGAFCFSISTDGTRLEIDQVL